MPVLKVKDRTTGNLVDALVDADVLPKVSQHSYCIDKQTAKPFRDVMENGKLKRYFLARDIFGCKMNDGRMIKYVSSNRLDNRRENLVEKLDRMPTTGFHWPTKVDSMINFLENREGPDEALCAEFLAKVDITKFSKKRIDAIATPSDYEELRSKNVELTFKRVMRKYFDCDSSINFVKENRPIFETKLTKTTETVEKKTPVLKLEPEVVQKNPTPPQQDSLCTESKPVSETHYIFDDLPEPQNEKPLLDMKKKLFDLSWKHPEGILELLEDNRLFPTENLIKVLQKRGANMIQFTR
jgi:hypothetical protein